MLQLGDTYASTGLALMTFVWIGLFAFSKRAARAQQLKFGPVFMALAFLVCLPIDMSATFRLMFAVAAGFYGSLAVTLFLPSLVMSQAAKERRRRRPWWAAQDEDDDRWSDDY